MYSLPTIDPRTEEILKAIIITYINKMEPVSSRKLAKMIDLNLSSASIRNIMADLEESGFLMQPHTSAGRVPTDQAYRFFVENLLKDTAELPEDVRTGISEQLSTDMPTEDLITLEIPRIINRLSSYIGVSLSPNFKKLIIRQMHFVTIDARKVLAVIVNGDGQVYQKVVDVDEPFDQEELNRVSNFINTNFDGTSLEDIRLKTSMLMSHDKNAYNDIVQNALLFSQKAIDAINEDDSTGNVHFEGTSTIFSLPELANVEKMKKVFEALMEKERLLILLGKLIQEDGITVCIGSESNNHNLEDLSLILSPYKKGNQIVGGLGVIGPTRMPYDRMIAMIDYLSKLVSTLLTSKEEKKFE